MNNNNNNNEFLPDYKYINSFNGSNFPIPNERNLACVKYIDNMNFLVPVHVGAVVGCYTEVVNVGRSSIQVIVEVWIDKGISGEKIKVTEGLFVFVAIDNNGRTRAVS